MRMRAGPRRRPAATFADAVSEAFAPGADTMYLVDISGSIEASGHLEEVRRALSMLALDEAGPAGAAVASGSRRRPAHFRRRKSGTEKRRRFHPVAGYGSPKQLAGTSQ